MEWILPLTITRLNFRSRTQFPVQANCSVLMLILYLCLLFANASIRKAGTWMPRARPFSWFAASFSWCCSFVSLRSSFAFRWPSWRSLISRFTRASTAVGSSMAPPPRTHIRFHFLNFGSGRGSKSRRTPTCSFRASARRWRQTFFCSFLVRGNSFMTARVGLVVGQGRLGVGRSGLLLCQQRRLGGIYSMLRGSSHCDSELESLIT